MEVLFAGIPRRELLHGLNHSRLRLQKCTARPGFNLRNFQMDRLMATPNRRLKTSSRFVEGVINTLIIMTIAGLCVLGMASAVDFLMGAVR